MTFDNNVPTKFPALAPKGPSGELLLATERAKGSFNVQELSKLMYTEEWLNKMNKVLEVMESEPAFDKTDRYFMSRKDKISTSLWKDKRLIEVAK
jgi:acyl-CoA oxidase